MGAPGSAAGRGECVHTRDTEDRTCSFVVYNKLRRVRQVLRRSIKMLASVRSAFASAAVAGARPPRQRLGWAVTGPSLAGKRHSLGVISGGAPRKSYPIPDYSPGWLFPPDLLISGARLGQCAHVPEVAAACSNV